MERLIWGAAECWNNHREGDIKRLKKRIVQTMTIFVCDSKKYIFKLTKKKSSRLYLKTGKNKKEPG